mgnify:CR=1 FL=1
MCNHSHGYVITKRNKNPIFIMLSDGTKLYLSWDEFRRVEGVEPEIGKKITGRQQMGRMLRIKNWLKVLILVWHG